ncbi:MAG: hypothetical protein U1A27_02460 [Phycisphaerae bacterium]
MMPALTRRRLAQALFAAAALGGTVAAPAAPDPPAQPRRETYDFTGVVVKVDVEQRLLIVRSGKARNYERHSVHWNGRTTIIKSKKPFLAADIRPDMRAWVYLNHDDKGAKSDLAARLTIGDPYPDLYGHVTAVDAERGTLVVLRREPGTAGRDRRRPVTVRTNDKTEIRVEGAPGKLDEIPLGRPVSVTSVRNARYKPTDVALKVSVRRAQPARSKDGKDEPAGDSDEE